MSLPFLVQIPDKFEPRRHPGRSTTLSADQQELIDQLDIIDQRSDLALKISVRAHNIGVIVGFVVLFIGGPVIISAYNNWRESIIGTREQVSSASNPLRP